MPTLRLRLDIPHRLFRHYYAGRVQAVQARSLDGLRVQFPAAALRPHLRHDGIHGLFELEFDTRHRFVALRRIGDG